MPTDHDLAHTFDQQCPRCPGPHGRAARCDHAVYSRRKGGMKAGGTWTMSPERRIARFWSKVDKSGECWVYLYHRAPFGYGMLWVNKHLVPAHRFSWELSNGLIPKGLWVLHHCDNPPCVRPDHLFLGTPQDNVHDMIAKGRARYVARPLKGEANPRAKLTEVQVREIRAHLTAGQRYRDIARQYGVSSGLISHIASGIAWKHVA